jgi:hypothetical protein
MHDATDRSATVTRLEPRPRYDYALVPAGEYDARVLDDHTEIYFRGAPKLVLTWSLCTMGHVGAIVRGYYAVPALIGRVGRHGRYRAVGFASRLSRDLCAMLGARPSSLAGPFPHDLVRDRMYRVAIETVTSDREQVTLPDGARYSVVRRVLGDAA